MRDPGRKEAPRVRHGNNKIETTNTHQKVQPCPSESENT